MLIDIFIEFLRAKNKEKTTLFQLSEKVNLFILSITLYELMMGVTDENKAREVYNIVNRFTILPFYSEASKIVSEINFP